MTADPLVIVTGLSGVGKSSVVAELTARGLAAVDTDDGYVLKTAQGRSWDIPRLRPLIERTQGPLFVAGAEENMVELFDDAAHIVLLSAPAEVMRERLLHRTTNPYGKSDDELAEALGYVETVEPLLRRAASLEIDTRAPLDEVVGRLVALVAPVPAPVGEAAP